MPRIRLLTVEEFQFSVNLECPDWYRYHDWYFSDNKLMFLQNGFHGDLNETFLVGNVDEAGRKLVEASYQSLSRAIEQGN